MKCLVTTLKASVDNPNLKRFGYMKFIVPANSTGRNCITFSSGVSPSFELKGLPSSSLYFSDSSFTENNGQTKSGTGDFYIVNSSDSEGVLWVSNAYDITELFTWDRQNNIEIDDSEDGDGILQNLTYVSIKKANKLNLNFITNTALTSIKAYNGGTGDLSHFSTFVNLTTVSFDSASLTGDISSLSGLTALTSIKLANMRGTGSWYGEITGKVETFLQGMLAAGRTSGTIKVDVHATKVTIKDAVTAASTSNEFHNATFSTNSISVVDKDGNLYIQYNGSSWLDANGDQYTP